MYIKFTKKFQMICQLVKNDLTLIYYMYNNNNLILMFDHKNIK